MLWVTIMFTLPLFITDNIYFIIAAAVIQLVGVIHAMHALMKVRSAQGTIAWILSLLTFPIISVPAYWYFGRDRFSGYVKARRADKSIVKKYENITSRMLEPHTVTPNDPLLSVALKLSDNYYTHRNHLQLYTDGRKTFDDIFTAIKHAERYILVNYYILKSDALGIALKDSLVEKAKQGVKVYLIFDELGSSKLPRPFLQEMRDAGVQCHYFGVNRFWWSRFQKNFRNHRKIVVIDGADAFIGGLNVGMEYLGWDEKLGFWRDTHMRMIGPAAVAVQIAFCEDYYWASGEALHIQPILKLSDEDQNLLILPTGPADAFDSMQIFVAEACNSAQEKLWIATPYFVPDTGVITALMAAAMRGVDVRIILPENADSMLVSLAAWSYYSQIIPAGVKIYRYQKGFMHQKVILSDNRAAVGTANIDNRSFRLNFEITGITDDRTFVTDVRKMLENDFHDCKLSKLSDYENFPWYKKAACRAARLLSPIL